MKIQYQYLIAYSTVDDEAQTGIGRTFTILSKPITQPDQLELIEATIRDQNGFMDVYIISYQIMSVIKTEEE